jgi:hypothetical protein
MAATGKTKIEYYATAAAAEARRQPPGWARVTLTDPQTLGGAPNGRFSGTQALEKSPFMVYVGIRNCRASTNTACHDLEHTSRRPFLTLGATCNSSKASWDGAVLCPGKPFHGSPGSFELTCQPQRWMMKMEPQHTIICQHQTLSTTPPHALIVN